MAAAGWQFPTWPEGLGGRGSTAAEGRAVAAELVEAGALGPPFSHGQVMGAPVVIQQGSDEQRARLVPPLADGTESWCQFFSEPEAGSDLKDRLDRSVDVNRPDMPGRAHRLPPSAWQQSPSSRPTVASGQIYAFCRHRAKIVQNSSKLPKSPRLRTRSGSPPTYG